MAREEGTTGDDALPDLDGSAARVREPGIAASEPIAMMPDAGGRGGGGPGAGGGGARPDVEDPVALGATTSTRNDPSAWIPRNSPTLSAHLLLVDRDRSSVALIGELLRSAWPGPITFTHTERIDDVTQQLLAGPVSAVLLGEHEDLGALEHVRSLAPGVPVLVLSRTYSDETAVAALRAGAQDYISRADLTSEHLRRRLLHAVERKRAELQLAHRALQDPLTSLPNRTLFMDRLSVALDRLRRSGLMIAVLFLDVDEFKLINDSMGHRVGDQVLTAMATRLRSVLRPMDTVARFGGDEFVFLFEGLTSIEEAVTIAERVREVASLPITIGGESESLSVSIGVATAADPGMSPDELIHQADGAMYHAKARGGGGATMAERPHSEFADDPDQAAQQLRQAVERGELRVVYQPMFKFERGREVAGFEALVRWEHPERGLLGPSEFLPLAEQLGLMPAIDKFVLEQALGLLGRLLPARAELTVSVNLAHDQLGETELSTALTTLENTGIGPDHLYVDIPEQLVSEHPDVAIRAAEILRSAGVRVALDDYGTGSVPLDDLRRLGADVLKIHNSIVGEVDAETHSSVVGAVVDLGHALGMKVLAEGVETDQQLLELRMLGCDAAQGYLLCRPVRADQLEELIMHADELPA
ncbi:MAG TPA: EAL domain-containing protein [Solirubrobacteraceae bacterium]|jgi:diguanylate cyclase (GGDEF)-like protein|nr:EAL domain-containing protein [Solirubrobacteraceae bacterium]